MRWTHIRTDKNDKVCPYSAGVRYARSKHRCGGSFLATLSAQLYPDVDTIAKWLVVGLVRGWAPVWITTTSLWRGWWGWFVWVVVSRLPASCYCRRCYVLRSNWTQPLPCKHRAMVEGSCSISTAEISLHFFQKGVTAFLVAKTCHTFCKLDVPDLGPLGTLRPGPFHESIRVQSVSPRNIWMKIL